MSKKILILANNSGGLYGFRKELIKKLISQGFLVYASTPFDDHIDDLKKLGVYLIETKIDRRGMNPIEDLKLILSYFRIMRKIKPSLIITYTIKPNLYGGTIARILNFAYVINVTGLGTIFQYDGLLKKIVILWYRYASKRAKVLFFENVGNKKEFLEFDIVKNDKCCVLHGAGVNTDYYYFTKYPPIKDKLHFLFIGRVMKEKGFDELLWSIDKIYNINKNVILDVVGSFEDNYDSKIKELEKKGCLHYYGYQKDVRPFIEQCHCFVLPSYHEGMANVLLEAASMGRPLITSNIHGCKEAINLSLNGLLVNVKDKEDLYKKMLVFINLSMEDKKNMSIESRRHMENVFEKNKVVEKTMDYIKIAMR